MTGRLTIGSRWWLVTGLLVTGLLVGPAGPADAAFSAGATPGAAARVARLGGHASGGQLVQVGRDESVVLSVNAETSADMVGVEIVVPAGFSPDLQRIPEVKGGGVGGVFINWQGKYSGQEIVANGAGIADGGVVLVTFSGTASHVGTLSFVTVTHAADGATVRWDGPATSAHPAALVYVVQSLSDAQRSLVLPGATGSSPASKPWWAVVIAGVGGVILLVGVVTGRRRRTF